MSQERSTEAAPPGDQSQQVATYQAPESKEFQEAANQSNSQLVPFVSVKEKKAAYLKGLVDALEADTAVGLPTLCFGVSHTVVVPDFNVLMI